MELLSFRQTAGPFGDGTSEYIVTVNKKDATIGDLIDYVLNERSKEWGEIHIRKQPGFLSINALYGLEYRWGEIVKNDIPDEVKKFPLTKIQVTGGWSYMAYEVYLKDLV